MVEQASRLVTEIPDYPIQPGNIDTFEVDPFFKISNAPNKLDIGIASRTFFKFAQNVGWWEPIALRAESWDHEANVPIEQNPIVEFFNAEGLGPQFWRALKSSGFLVFQDGAYHPTTDFVERAMAVSPITPPIA